MAGDRTLAVDARFHDLASFFYVIGAQKCGTTWLHSYMAQHPQVCVPLRKELNYWYVFDDPKWGKEGIERDFKRRFRRPKVMISRAFGRIPPKVEMVDQGIKLAYLAVQNTNAPHCQYADAVLSETRSGTRAWGECCPQYSVVRHKTFVEMASIAPHVRFIYMLRDPVARIVSGIKHGLRRHIGATNVDQDALIARTKAELKKKRSFDVRMTSYDKTIAALESAVPANSIKYVFFEELFQQDQVDDICHFIGVDPVKAKLDKKVNFDPDPDLGIPDDLRAELIVALSDVYHAMDAKFGAALPAAWRRSMAHLTTSETVNG